MLAFSAFLVKMSERLRNVRARLLFRNTGHNHKGFNNGMVKRVRPDDVDITTESIDFKAKHSASAKNSQSWRYAGGNIQRADSIRINGTDYPDPKDKSLPRRKQESNFFITINSNKAIAPDDKRVNPGSLERAYSAMEAMLESLSQEKVLATYLKFGPKNREYLEDKYVDVIHSVSWNSAVERGEEVHRVHAHIWLTITHFSQIQINVQMLMHLAKHYYNRHLNGEVLLRGGMTLNMKDNPYVHVKLLPQSDWTTVMRQYIHKGMSATSSNSSVPMPSVDTNEF